MTNEYEQNVIGGLGIVAIHLTQALAQAGTELDVSVLTKSTAPKITKEDNFVRVICFPRNSIYHSVSSQTFNPLPIVKWLKDNGCEKPDLIHVHSFQFTELVRYYKRKFKIPVIYTCHSLVALEEKTPSRDSVAKCQKELMNLADAITVPSIWQKNKIKQIHPFLLAKVKVIPNGVSIRKEAIGIKASSRRLLYVGRLIRMKGIEELLHAVRLLKKKKQRVSLHVIGKGSVRYTSKLKLLAQRLGITSRVHWLGQQPPAAVQDLYCSYGAVVVPSHQESFGLVALEAMANGIPLVSTRVGGLSSFVNNSNASIIPKVTEAAIANSIQAMWNQPKLTKNRIIRGKITSQRYEWTKIFQKYQALFDKYGLRGAELGASKPMEAQENLES